VNCNPLNLCLAGDGGAPFATQFFNDDDEYGGGGFDDAYDGGGEGMAPAGLDEDADLLAATQGQVRRVRPEFVNYAKKVKRVDVRKLKENIWKGLDIVVPKAEEEVSRFGHVLRDRLTLGLQEDDVDQSRNPTDPTEPKQFTSVITGLRKTYPKDKMEEISTSFCFICLLHLANERGLKIEGEDDGGLGAKMSGLTLAGDRARRMMDEDDPGVDADEIDMSDSKERVSDIWGLRIYRDPDAIPSA
jgi:condensin complex subunit 2